MTFNLASTILKVHVCQRGFQSNRGLKRLSQTDCINKALKQ